MQITLVQSEIETAIINYVKTLCTFTSGDFKVDISATRGASGITASINFEPEKNKAGCTQQYFTEGMIKRAAASNKYETPKNVEMFYTDPETGESRVAVPLKTKMTSEEINEETEKETPKEEFNATQETFQHEPVEEEPLKNANPFAGIMKPSN